LAADGGYDLVHSFDRVRRCDVYRAGDGVHREWLRRRRAAQPAWRRAIPSLNPLHLVYLALERGLFEGRAKAIVANSERGKAEILAHYRADPNRIRVIYNGVDLDRFRPPDADGRNKARAHGIRRGRPHGPLRGVGICAQGRRGGRAGARKVGGAIVRTDVARRRGARRCRAVPTSRVVARDRRSCPLRRAIDRCDDVVPRGGSPAPAHAVRSFANVCLEALACGVPVVTSAANGAAEILTEETGVVVEAASDVTGFAAAVDTVLGWGPSRAAACRRVAERYSLERHLREMLSLYEAVRASSR
jgi:UDP-glucose:(heptosyl)LPS alpha-1,3-glucosyltransferase